MLDLVRRSDLLARAGVGSLLLLELLVVAPFALAATGGGLREGVRNPSDSAKASSETQIIADTSGYSTRQSNVSSTGGGAIYGCRSGVGGTTTGNEPCLRANNLRDGLAFEFQATRGNVGGIIQFGPSLAKPADATPFVTNGTATVKNLSADRLDGIDSSRLATKSDITALNNRIDALGQRELGLAQTEAGGQSDILLFNDKDPLTVPLGLRLACDSLPDGRVRARIIGIGAIFSVSGSAGILIPSDGAIIRDPPLGRESTIDLISLDSKPDTANTYTYSYSAEITGFQPSFTGPERLNLLGTLVVRIRPSDNFCIARATM